MFYYFLKIKHHSKLKAVSNQSLGKGMGEQHWVTSDSAQCIKMILTGVYADSLSTWYCVLLDVHCFTIPLMSFLRKCLYCLSWVSEFLYLWCGWFGHAMSTISNDQEFGMWYYFKLRLKDIIPYRVVDWPCKIKKIPSAIVASIGYQVRRWKYQTRT